MSEPGTILPASPGRKLTLLPLDTPYVAIIVCAVIYSFFTLSAFSSLVVIDVIVYAASLLLEFAALTALRVYEPRMKRPVRVPGSWLGLAVVTLLSTGVLALALYSTWVEEASRRSGCPRRRS